MTKYFALMGMGMNMMNNGAFGNNMPKANKIPNAAPEAPTVIKLLSSWDVCSQPYNATDSDMAERISNYHAASCTNAAPIPVVM